MFDQLPRSEFSSLSLAWASFSFDRLKSLEEKKIRINPVVSRTVVSSFMCQQHHLDISGQGSQAGWAEPGDQSNWPLTRQHKTVRVLPGSPKILQSQLYPVPPTLVPLLPAPRGSTPRYPLLCHCTCPDMPILL